MTFHALWILCALGAIVIAAAGAAHTRQLVAFVAGAVVAASVTGPDRLPDPVWAGALGVAAAAIYLCWPRHAVMSAAIGGAFAGMLTALLEVQGVPRVVALVVAAVVPAVTVWLARTQPSFAPEILRDDGLLAIGALGLVVAVLPGVLDGWQAAENLTVEVAGADRSARTIPAWTMTLVAASMASGALYSVWSRR